MNTPAREPRVPLLSIVVPAYNAETYLPRALAGLLGTPADLEVVIVDDGSTDGTGAVADAVAAAHPETVRVLHQRNAGHGGAINTGIAAATGVYVRVLDADDWLDPDALAQTLHTLATLEGDGGVDALITDYVHERAGKRSRSRSFDAVFPAGRTFGWDESARLGRRQFVMMHAVVFRREIVREGQLPQHTFYVDSLFVLGGLARTRRLHYLPVPLYRYFIGRPGQSVQADVMLARVDQQLRVNRLALQQLPSPSVVPAGTMPIELYAFLVHHIEALCAVTSATLSRGGTSAHLAQRAMFWREVKAESPWIYARMRRSMLGASANLPGAAGRRVTSLAYHVARRVVGFS